MSSAPAEIETADWSPADQKTETDRRAAFDQKAAADRKAETDRRTATDSRAAASRDREPHHGAAPDAGSAPANQAPAKADAGTKPAPAPKVAADKQQAADRARAATRKRWILGAILLVAAGALAAVAWWVLRPKGLEAGFESGNGRIEATEVGVAAKMAGRVSAILVNEGDFVKRGDVVARMDIKGLDAQRAEAAADLAKAQSGIAIAKSQVAQQQSGQAAAAAVVVQRRADLNVAAKRLARSRTLSKEGAASVQEYDNDLAGQQSSAAAVNAATAQVAAADAAILTARAQLTGAEAGVDAARATIARIDADIDDSALKSPRDARVQYRVAQPAEVVAAGGIVLNLVDLTDVYMTLFLPDAVVGRIALGAEVRIVLDAAPQFVIPARVSFLADVAQFTPKTVETASERQKLMFRIKARIDPTLLRRLARQVKTGLPGVAYVRLDATKAWPERLAVHEPD